MGTKKPTNLMISRLKTLLRWFLRGVALLMLLFLIAVAVIFSIDRWVSWQTQPHIISDINKLPKFDVAVVLGTSKYLGRTLNDYYLHRIEAAVELYQLNKTDYFLLSGDNAHRSYNEPWTMKRDLLKAGVPDEQIYLDYAGFRTLDSIVRAKRIFDTDDFLIVTQRFHCERALFIAQHHEINATCLAVPGPKNHLGYKVRLREVFARSKAVLDLYFLDTQPRFLGPKEPILSESRDNGTLSENSVDESDWTQE
ncbi:SanA/YdcF family protein [Vibrio metschnikovii]|uniref:SanA/YdcF family protein n=1 Tax=Vibrio metschnikovii TaxID=28172 RepID=UPI001C305473|nr:ElyC/SanA/YdcF family protein [Vibrio metschnikovii]